MIRPQVKLAWKPLYKGRYAMFKPGNIRDFPPTSSLFVLEEAKAMAHNSFRKESRND
jgi:hypothetical protein